MVNQLLLAGIFSILPFTELRLGMPLAIDYAIKNSINVGLIFALIVFLNCLIVLYVFFFLDFFHEKFMSLSLYRRLFGLQIERLRKKVDKFEKRYANYGFLALMLFVAVPFPTTGAFSGSFIAWLLELERKQSIIALIAGIVISGIIMFLASLGFISLFF